jgi:TonB family protein
MTDFVQLSRPKEVQLVCNENEVRDSALRFWPAAGRGLRLLLAISLAVLPSLAVMGQDVANRQVFVSADKAVPHGTWRYRQFEDDTPVWCRYQGHVPGPPECVLRTLRVENASGDTLECEGHLTYDGVNNENVSSMFARTVIMARETRDIMRDRAKPDVPLTGATLDCTARAPRSRPDIPKECKLQVLEAPSLEDFYPPTARRLAEQGPVEVSFVLKKAQGHASDISVVASSLSDRLDKAAVQYVESVKFGTQCPSTRYELKILFKLEGGG